MVTWDSALGATSYTVYARGSLGHSAKCNSTSTECNFFDLGCGQDYIMTVVAYHDTCSSLVSEAINVTTGKNRQNAHCANGTIINNQCFFVQGV